MHIDAQQWPDYDSNGIHTAWDDFLMRSGRATDFIRAVNRQNRPMVFNWGLPMCNLFVVAAFQAEGVEAWWLRGDRTHARNAFVAREQKKPGGGSPVALFDAQMAEIDRHWLLIERLFGEHPIDGLQADGSQREPADMWKELTARDEKLRD